MILHESDDRLSMAASTIRDASVVGLPRPTLIGTDPTSSFVCDYVAGINRVLSLPPYVLIDNIGRNVEVWRFETGASEPISRSRYDLAAYPNDPIASLLDLDIHAAFLRRSGQELLTINHYGCVRRFELPAPSGRMQPCGEWQLLGDTERLVMAGDAFIGSSPRGEHTDDPARPGVFLFAPFASLPESTVDGVPRLPAEQVLADWGVIGALAVTADGSSLAVAAGSRLGMFDLAVSGSGLRLGPCRWESNLATACQWLEFDDGSRLWTGGYRPSPAAESGDWNACTGGHVESFSTADGARDLSFALPESTAWGYGADPIVLTPAGRDLLVLGRDASLHHIDLVRRDSRQIYGSCDVPADAAEPSLGIGHAALRDDAIYAGFSRGGFRLLRYDLARAYTR